MQYRELLQTHDSLEHLRERSESIGQEFFAGFEVVEEIDRPAVSCFGSARAAEGSRPYELARETARLFAEAGWAVVTGGGPGVMEAANRGCREGGGLSVGFGIELPHEQRMNDYIDLGLVFDHFYARKTMFVKAAEGFCVFPGGFGTADELFESLVLIQTGKVMHFPVVLMGEAYWTPLLEWVRRSALADGMVSPEDLALLTLTDDPPLAVDAARTVIDRAREEIQAGADPGDLAARLRAELIDARRPRLQGVLNATGVVVHTNLGRAPLAEEAVERVAEVGRASCRE